MIHQFVNPNYFSNTFIIETNQQNVIIVDPGNNDISPIKTWLIQNKKTLVAVILTHEHFDHCAGVNALYEWSSFELICTQTTAKNIGNSRQNFSFYIDNAKAFEIKLPTKTVSDGDIIHRGTERFDFIETPGHSPGGLCIKTEDAFFTGDTLLNKTKTPLSFPHSNKKDYHRSVEKLKKILIPGNTIYPGHGEPYVYSDFKSYLIL